MVSNTTICHRFLWCMCALQNCRTKKKRPTKILQSRSGRHKCPAGGETPADHSGSLLDASAAPAALPQHGHGGGFGLPDDAGAERPQRGFHLPDRKSDPASGQLCQRKLLRLLPRIAPQQRIRHPAQLAETALIAQDETEVVSRFWIPHEKPYKCCFCFLQIVDCF